MLQAKPRCKCLKNLGNQSKDEMIKKPPDEKLKRGTFNFFVLSILFYIMMHISIALGMTMPKFYKSWLKIKISRSEPLKRIAKELVNTIFTVLEDNLCHATDSYQLLQ